MAHRRARSFDGIAHFSALRAARAAARTVLKGVAMRRPPLRAPFLVTVTAVAATFTAACGGGGAAGAVTTDSTTDSGTTDTKNPPECPPTQPTFGATCSKVMTCFYGEVDECGNRNGASCDGKTWTFFGSSCNPPPPDCPKDPPILGSACDTYGWGGCGYRDTCGVEEGWISYVCESGRWTMMGGSAPEPSCPDVEPVNGTDCRTCLGRLPKSGCRYTSTDCPGVPLESYAYCDTKTGKWLVSISTCNPPPPDADAGSPEPSP